MRAVFITVLLIWIHILEGASKTCDSIDIRNNVTELEKLNNCTVIVGYLEILLIETTTSFDDYSFPELREITEFLLFYRVNNLSSIGTLFPNLAVIRGQNIFVNYALVIYEMKDLREIGLYNLVRISRGSVRIEKNPNLHYIKTINWELITDNKDVDIFIEKTLVEQRIACSSNCEIGCWYQDKCQRVIDPQYCHPECLAGCQGKNNNKCDVCRNYRDGEHCVSTCSANRYSVAHLFTCIDKDECLDMGDDWFIFGTECLTTCPPRYEKKNGTCILCESLCPKVCNGSMIVNMLSLQEFKGCTNITGTLSIRLDTPIKNIERELEENLGNIEEITEYLKVYRSINIRNLTFFKNLRSIRGDRLEQNRYSLIIHENSNLQKLWDWDNFTLDIGNGTFSFHFNPKLCLSEIEKLANFSHLEHKYSDIDVSNHSNGDNFACTFIDIEVNVSTIHDNNVTLIWNPLSKRDKQQAVRYLIYYKEVEDDGSVLEEEEEEICGSQSWMITFVNRADNETDLAFTWNITNLKTYTKYMYYVRTDFMLGGRSELQYFMTSSGDPSVPMNVRTEPVGDDAIRLSWEKPINLNGILSHYIIVGFIQEDDQDVIDYRNYCRVKPTKTFKKETIMETTTTEAPIMNDNCTCKKEGIIQVIQEEDFDAICTDLDKHKHNKPQGAHSGCGSYKYQVIPNHKLQDDVAEQIIHKRQDTTQSDDENNQIINGVYYNFERQATSSDTSYVIHQLKHYSIYILLLAACNVNQTMDPQCSSVVMVSQRTGRQEGADNIEDVTVSTVNYNADIGWFEPKYPNAVIVSYEIQYQNLNSENSNNLTECITRKKHEKNKNKYRINNLHPGTYRVSVRANSLAGPGNFSVYKTVIISPPPQASSLLWLIVAFIFLIALGAVIVVLYYRYKIRHKLDNMQLIANVNPDYAGYREDDWEMERDNIEIYNELGQGTFGQVYSGLIKDENVLCAIKTVNEKATVNDIMEFLNEASVMKSFNEAHHVIRLLGVVSRTPRPLVVMELMVRGDLKSFLRTTRDSSTSLTCLEMYRMAAEIADGMAYLAAKKFVHRDLAARNCMVSADRTVKIGDFGMTRDIYETDYYRKETHGLLPVRWMAPESLADGVFTSDSDVWSYGIVLWEIATLAEQPYQGLANEQVLQFVTAKGTLERPLQCPDLLYDIMEVCWKWNPPHRPLFTDVVEKLEMNVGQDFRLVSFYHSRDGEDYRMNKVEINKMRSSHMPAMAQGRVAAHWSRDADEVHFHTEPAARSINSIASLSCHSPPNDYSPFPLSTSVPRFGE